MKDKSLAPGIYISLGMIITTLYAYSSEIIFFWFALLTTIYGIIKIVENYEKLSN